MKHSVLIIGGVVLVQKKEKIENKEIVKLLSSAIENYEDAVKIENLYLLDGTRGFSLGQGQ